MLSANALDILTSHLQFLSSTKILHIEAMPPYTFPKKYMAKLTGLKNIREIDLFGFFEGACWSLTSQFCQLAHVYIQTFFDEVTKEDFKALARLSKVSTLKLHFDNHTIDFDPVTIPFPEEEEQENNQAGKSCNHTGKSYQDTDKSSNHTGKSYQDTGKSGNYSGKSGNQNAKSKQDTGKNYQDTGKIYQDTSKTGQQNGNNGNHTGKRYNQFLAFQIDSLTLAHFEMILSHFPNVSCLHLSSGKLNIASQEELEALSSLIKRCQNLKEMCFNFAIFEKEVFATIFSEWNVELGQFYDTTMLQCTMKKK
jgi:hypothetical protein